MKVVAVVVTYNRKQLLLDCLAHLADQRFDQNFCSLDILVVDNASTDGTGDVVASIASSRLHYVNTGANLGGAGGFSFGMREAVQRGFDYAWVMDDDCLPDSGALDALLAAHRTLSGAYGYLSSVVRWTDGSPCAMNIQRHPLFSNIADFAPALQPCTLASFVSLFVPADVIRRVGLPIAEFFIWTDDWEFTRRISRLLPCYVVGESTVVHASASNGAGNIYTDGPDRLDRYRYVYRNDVVLYRQEGLRGRLFLVVRAAYHIARVLASAQGQKARRVGLIVTGNLQGVRFNPSIEYV